ncbi:MAG: hypothetical protein AAF674_07020 [Pseudomonadota bacterium]
MLKSLSRTEQSRLHIAALQALGQDGSPPKNAENASAAALADAVAHYAGRLDFPLWTLLRASDAVMAEIYRQHGADDAPIAFDIPSLRAALTMETREAIMVARLCGAMQFTENGKTLWKNTDGPVDLVTFEPDLLDGYT